MTSTLLCPEEEQIQDFRRRGRQPSSGGQHKILQNFLKNYLKLRNFWVIRGRVPGRPLRSASAEVVDSQLNQECIPVGGSRLQQKAISEGHTRRPYKKAIIESKTRMP